MNRKRLGMIVHLGLAAAWLASAGCAAGAAQQPAPNAAASAPTLYERLGGIHKISVLMDDVIERSYVSPVFHANARIAEAHARFPKPAYKYSATSLACMVTGGPQKYTGRSIKEAHEHLQITDREWQELRKIFRDSMNGLEIPQHEQEEVLAIIESARADVVVAAPKSAANP